MDREIRAPKIKKAAGRILRAAFALKSFGKSLYGMLPTESVDEP
jgi:hypothetical protein